VTIELSSVATVAAAVLEVAGIATIVLGALWAALRSAGRRGVDPGARYRRFRLELGKAILLGLEFLVGADIIRSVSAEPTLGGVSVLGLIVVVRTFLSFTFVSLAGDPTANIRQNPQFSAVTVANLQHKYHLDESIPVRYVYWLQDVFEHKLGSSLVTSQPIWPDIERTLGHQLERAAVPGMTEVEPVRAAPVPRGPLTRGRGRSLSRSRR
jgi:uncharacterized membrane protein